MTSGVQPFLVGEGWITVRDGDDSFRAVFDRHYSRRHYANGCVSLLCLGPGQKLPMVTADVSGIFAWRKFKSDDAQTGINCAVFRREGGDIPASELVKQAMVVAWEKWPSERLYTYVNPRKVKPTLVRGIPCWGFCFLKAGWHYVGLSKGGLLIWACEGR